MRGARQAGRCLSLLAAALALAAASGAAAPAVDVQRLYHDPARAAMRWREPDGQVVLRVHTGQEVEAAWVVLGADGERRLPMRTIGASRLYRYWETNLEGPEGAGPAGPGALSYRFAVQARGAPPLFLGEDGVGETAGSVRPWTVAWSDVPLVAVPSWVSSAVFYQIFPDRFANGDPSNDPPGTVPRDALPTPTNFFGGDLQGVIDRAGYLAELGVSAIWFNPLFDAPSNHRYDTRDYRRIDPYLGDEATFARMVQVLHELGIRVVLDGVFNHTGDRFWAFQDVEQRGPASPYYDWYEIWRWPLSRQPPSYRTWSGYAHMPKLNHANPAVRRYLFDTVRYWMGFGVDGWRLDVANEVPHDFWRAFRQVVKAVNPDAYLVGEIWGNGEPWLRGDQFDGVMNYRFRDALLQFFALGRIPPSELDARLAQIRADYPGPVFFALLNLLDSHDTERFLTAARGDVRRVKLAALLQMTYPGAPLVYYGDEVGLPGGRDPDNRRPFPWQPDRQDLDLLRWYRTLVALRRCYPVLSRGDVVTLAADDATGVYAYARELQAAGDSGTAPVALVALNRSEASVQVRLAVPSAAAGEHRWLDLLSGAELAAQDGAVQVPLGPMQGRLLVPRGPAGRCGEQP